MSSLENELLECLEVIQHSTRKANALAFKIKDTEALKEGLALTFDGIAKIRQALEEPLCPEEENVMTLQRAYEEIQDWFNDDFLKGK